LSIIGIGTDIIEIERVKASIDRSGDTFLNKIFTSDEIEYCESKGKAKWESYAARFAAKEAFTKAVPTEVDKNISWKDVEVIRKHTGKVEIRLSDLAVQLCNPNWLYHVSLSHHKTSAVAFVLIEERAS